MFQNFDPPATDRAASRERVAALRRRLAERGLAGVLVPHDDEYQGEYLPASAERLAWLTGFTGSAGLAIVLADRAALFVDGRYTLQAADQADPELFEVIDSGRMRPSTWLADHLEDGDVVGYDAAILTVAEIRRLQDAAADADARLEPLEENPVDAIWADRPAPPAAPVRLHPIALSGREAAEKLADVAAAVRCSGADGVIVTASDSVAWLFNIRGADVPHTPVVLSRAIVPASGRPVLFVAPEKLGTEVRARLEEVAEVAPEGDIAKRIGALASGGGRILLDPQQTPESFARAVEIAGGTIVEGADPVAALRAVKNDTEIAGTRAAHQRDGVALARFLAWLDREAKGGGLDEIAVAEALEAFRRDTGALEDISFDTISGSGPNGAIVHYRVNRATNRRIGEGDLLLVDSGAQYRDGTTDVTRTIAIGTPTTEMRTRFTRVLKGHVAIATARFPTGTTGAQIDALARIDLWRAGLDYDHGTGHGVGSFLSVHEGPQRISRLGHAALQPGMILSNEPGYYAPGRYGIRIENLVIVAPPRVPPGGEREMLSFETLTLAPIDLSLVDPTLLTPAEIAWLDGYHARVHGALSGDVDGPTRAFLEAATRPIA